MRKLLKRFFGLPTARDYTAKLVASGKCHRALDIGCGQSSPLSEFRPAIWTAGVDAFEDAVDAARSQKLHDAYLVADVLFVEPAEIMERLGGGGGGGWGGGVGSLTW